MTTKITHGVLEKIFAVCKEMFPSEIAGILLSTNGDETVDDFVFLPGEYTNMAVYIRDYERPIYHNARGTFHSHPTRSATPSSADKNYFSKFGRIHFIIAYPYNEKSIRAYDAFGNVSRFEVL